jgi:rod shape-determining protein MreC
LRTIAYGTGASNRLSVPNIPQSADVRVGDVLLTSGIGGRFPAGLPVAVVNRVGPEDTHLFIEAEAEPLAALDRSGQVLLVWNDLDAFPIDVGPPEPAEPTPP